MKVIKSKGFGAEFQINVAEVVLTLRFMQLKVVCVHICLGFLLINNNNESKEDIVLLNITLKQ